MVGSGGSLFGTRMGFLGWIRDHRLFEWLGVLAPMKLPGHDNEKRLRRNRSKLGS